MKYLVAFSLVVVAIIHLLPVSGVISAERLTVLYGLPFDEPNLVILMRHRAVLFGLLGGFLLYSAFKTTLQPLALLAGFVSVLSFVWLAWSVGDYNDSIARVVIADIVALGFLVLGSAGWVVQTYRQRNSGFH